MTSKNLIKILAVKLGRKWYVMKKNNFNQFAKQEEKEKFYATFDTIKDKEFKHSYNGDYSVFVSVDGTCEYVVNDDLGIVSSITIF